MYEAITGNRKIYTPLLLDWSLRKFKETIDHAKTQRGVKDFYDLDPPIPGLMSAVFGAATKPKVRVFSKEGDKLYVEGTAWGSLKNVDNLQTFRAAFESLPDLVREETAYFDSNAYRKIADRMAAEKDEYTFVLLKGSPNVPPSAKKISVFGTLMTEYSDNDGED